MMKVRYLNQQDSKWNMLLNECTVWLVSTARFSVHILLLRHYKSYLAHISDLYSLVIGMYKSEMREKILKKRMTSSICTKFAHFLVVLVRKCMVKKYLISYCFVFFIVFFPQFLDNSVRAFFILFGQEGVCNIKIT